MESTELLMKAVTVVGSVEMLKNYLKNVKVPGVVWAIAVILFSILYSLPCIPEWVMNAALLCSVSTLSYDYILQSIKKKFLKDEAGENE